MSTIISVTKEVEVNVNVDISDLDLTFEEFAQQAPTELKNLWDNIADARYNDDKQALDRLLEKGIELHTGRLVRFG